MQRSNVQMALELATIVFLAANATLPALSQNTSSEPSAPSAQQVDLKQYLKPQTHLPNPISPYVSRHEPLPGLANTPRLSELMHDGKLYISINEAVALALENNLDLAIARYNPKIADTDLWRAEAGSTISGVDTGVVQNTPGGGVGGLGSQVGTGQGGTSVGAGGAGAGAGGLVGSTLGSGPQISSFDPIVTGTLLLDHLTSQCNTPLCGTQQNTGSANFTYSQGFHWGTDMTIGFMNSRVATNSDYDLRSPALTSSFQFKLTHHLLQGFGLATNTRYIQIARNNREISDVAFRDQIVTTVDQILNMYWDLVYAYENVKVHNKLMEFARKTLSNNQAQVAIGSLSQIEVVRAQTAIANEQQSLTLALTNLELTQLLMKNALSRTLDDPVLADADVIPTSTIELPAREPAVPTQDLVNEAFANRPELAEAHINMTNTEISNKAVRSALLPTLDLSAYYGGSGLGGVQNPGYVCLSNPGVCGSSRSLAALPPISYGGTLSQLVDGSAPDKGATVSLSIPIRNRAAQATQVRSEFEHNQAQLHIQQLENQIRIEVRSAQFGVQQNRTSVDSAQAAVDLARQSMALEKQKFDLRASTEILVLQNQTALVQAEATLLSARVAYEKAAIELDRSVGLLLEHAGIRIDEAQRGQITQPPSVPHVVMRPAAEETPVDQTAQPQM
jgi:outer membrane protein TolC